MEQNRRISGQTGLSLSVVNAVWGAACTHADTQTHFKIIRLPPTIHSWNSAFPAPAAVACASVRKGDADSAAEDGREVKNWIPAKNKRKHFFSPARQNRCSGTDRRIFFSPVCFYIYFTVNVHERRKSAAGIRDSSVRAGLLEAGTEGEGA